MSDWVKELEKPVTTGGGPITDSEIDTFVSELAGWEEPKCEAKHMTESGERTGFCSQNAVWRATRDKASPGCFTVANVCSAFRARYVKDVASGDVIDDLTFRPL